ncbi:hypothetical protein RN22_04450 [Grimontia sp. AD028]|uniref:hypothetical protein n=1 Tax=Grimontia sp. AD028 TaxID=1581149 RepID=UPI00061B2A39|nr:hypothetical protein [Grimontia sp. AD028]KKD61697.1 hypothetical protein RN22_04450 [Grimontia sp. AD028]
MEIDQLVKNGNIEKSRELLFKRMVRSVYLINETANKLSVENGKNEALNALYHFKYYLPQEGFLELYPESNDWSLKKMHNTLKSIDYPEVEPPKYGKSDDWRRAWFIKTDSLLKKTESASLTRQ